MSKLAKALTAAAGNAAQEPDPYFNYVSLLLGTDGFDGGQNNTFTDSSSNDHTITRSGDTTQGSVNPFGDNWSNYFDGSSYLTFPTVGVSEFLVDGNFTVESWIYPVSGRTFIFATCGNNSSTRGFNFTTSSSYYLQLFGYVSNAVIAIGTTPVPFNQWSHVAATRSGSTVRLFLNGNLEATATNTQTFNPTTNGGIGAPSTNRSFYSNGYSSNVRFLKGTALYTSAFTPSTEPLTAISGTELLTCQSNSFKDSSTNDLTITVSGNPKVTPFSPFADTKAYSPATGGSGYFKGTTDELSIPNDTSLNLAGVAWTAECWVYLEDDYSDYGVIFAKLQSGGTLTSYEGFIDITSGNLSYYNGTIYESTGQVPRFTWTHLAWSHDGTALKMFLNGTQVFNQNIAVIERDYPLFIGGLDGYVAQNFGGYISNFRIVKGTAVYTSDFTPPTAPVTAISGTSLLLNFEDASIYDFAETNNLLTVADAQVDTAVTKFNTASMKFDGTGDYLKVFTPDRLNLGVGSFTIEGWINVSSVDTTYRCVVSAGYPIQIFTRNGTVECYFNDTDNGEGYIVVGLTGPSSSISADTWHHIAVVRDGTTFTAYVDGVAGTPDTGVTEPVVLSASDASVGIFNSSSLPFTGYIQDLRITKGIARYTTAFTPPTAAFPNF